SSRSAALLSLARRSVGPRADHFGKAAAVASAAARASATEAAAARVAISPETGSRRLKGAEPAAGTSRPAINRLTVSMSSPRVNTGSLSDPSGRLPISGQRVVLLRARILYEEIQRVRIRDGIPVGGLFGRNAQQDFPDRHLHLLAGQRIGNRCDRMDF